MRSGLHHLIADAIGGHGDRKKDVKSLYLTINDADLVRVIDRLTFDHGKTEIWRQISTIAQPQVLTPLEMFQARGSLVFRLFLRSAVNCAVFNRSREI